MEELLDILDEDLVEGVTDTVSSAWDSVLDFFGCGDGGVEGLGDGGSVIGTGGDTVSFGGRQEFDYQWERDKIEHEMVFATGDKYDELKEELKKLDKAAQKFVESEGYAKGQFSDAIWNASHRK